MAGSWMRIALINFFFAACIGAVLRIAFVVELPWLNYRHAQHAHSHVAMLGWVYLAFFALLLHVFPADPPGNERKYTRLFWASQCTVIGMLISFSMVGHGALSIFFSILHTLLAYLFIFHFLREGRLESTSWSGRFTRAALYFFLVSTLGLWALGPIRGVGLQGSAWYYGAIQFYWHFQFNGWFIFAVLGLFFRFLEERSIELPPSRVKLFFRTLVASCVLTFALAVAWSTPLKAVFWTNSLGVALQLVAAMLLVSLASRLPKGLSMEFSRRERVLLGFAFACLLLKIAMQSALVVPEMARVGYTIRNYVIGFLHLLLLGSISSFLLAFGSKRTLMAMDNRLAGIGIGLFLTGFVLSEGLLFLQGTMWWATMGFLPYYYEMLFLVSVFLPIGILFLLIGRGRRVNIQEHSRHRGANQS